MKRLITERDVQRLPPGAKLALDRDTLVTPAARDLAFSRGIDLVSEGASGTASPRAPKCGCNGCQSGGPCACAGPWPTLPDGDYLLEVRSGKVRVRRVDS